MQVKTIMALAAASLVGMAFAQDQVVDTNEAEVQPVVEEVAAAPVVEEALAPQIAESEALDEEKSQLVAAKFKLSFHSKYINYGTVDGKDPVVKPFAEIAFFDTLYFGVNSNYHLTKGNGKRTGRGNRAGEWHLLHGVVGLRHGFDLGETLGTLTVDGNYTYEYIRRYRSDMGDTQYLNLTFALNDLWLEPSLWLERDIMADEGTYANLEVGHTFGVCENLTLRPAVAQGLGNTQRAHGYFSRGKYAANGFDHGGLMDTTLSLTAEWALCDNLALTGSVAYYDYLLDANMRDGAREHNRTKSGGSRKYADSAQFVGILALKASF